MRRGKAGAEDKDRDSNGSKKSETSSGNLGKDIKDWFERKKAEGTGGAGGAVVGGMLAGPLGAIVGANVGARLAPAMDDLLKTFEGEEDGRDQPGRSGNRRQADEVVGPPQLAKTPKAERQPAASQQQPMDAEPQELVASRRESRLSAQEPQVAAVLPALAEADVLEALRENVSKKRQRLEANIDEFYAKAEEAMLAGDELAAREFLISRDSAKAALESLLEGQRRREERRRTLESEAEELYAKAEKALSAGDEAAARSILACWKEAKKLLALECSDVGKS